MTPNEQAKEAPYIKRNIEATRTAYGIGTDKVQNEHVRRDARRPTEDPARRRRHDRRASGCSTRCCSARRTRTCSRSRPTTTSPTTLDVDRYDLTAGTARHRGGGARARHRRAARRTAQLDQRPHRSTPTASASSRRWATEVDGRPPVVRRPPTSRRSGQIGRQAAADLLRRGVTDLQHRRCTEGAPPQELDYPDDSASSGQRNTTYEGKGGVPLGSLWHKLLVRDEVPGAEHPAVGPVNADSKILYDRDAEGARREGRALADPRRRPVPGGGRRPDQVDRRRLHDQQRLPVLHAHAPSSDATADSLHRRRRTSSWSRRSEQVNYIRNSVKATVDAYDGTVTLYSGTPRTRSSRPG